MSSEALIRKSTLMHRFLCILLAIATLCMGSTAQAQATKPGPRPAAPPAPPKAHDRADELFDEGAAAYHAGRLPEAEEKLTQAWTIKKTHDIAGNLGVVEFNLGKFPQAAQYLTWALQHFPPTESSKARRGYEQLLEKARAQSASMRIRVNVDGAEITVNGRAVGTTPMADEVFVAPGTANVVARRDGYATAQQGVAVAQGEAREVSLVLEPITSKPERRSVVPGVVLGSVAGVALVTGIGLFAGGRSKASSARDLHDAILKGGVGCVSGAAHQDPKCEELYSTTSTGNTLQKAGVGLMIGAGAAAIGTLIYFVLPSPRSGAPTSGALRVTPTLLPNNAGLVFSGTF
jgi:hypothetical protein